MQKKFPRRATRYPLRLEVKELNGRPGDGAILLDLSALGAALESAVPLAPRNPVNFTIRLPEGDRDIQFSGVVMWMRPVMTSPGRFRMGVRFHEAQWWLDQLGRSGRLGAGG